MIRKATSQDIPSIYKLILELADFENGLHEVTMTEAQLLEDGFGKNKLYECIVAEKDNQIVGISLYYYRFSTWKGKRLYLEDLMVTETYQKKGIGKALLDETFQIAKNTHCTGMMWQVLDWNVNAIEFYKKYDANFHEEWLNVNVDF